MSRKSYWFTMDEDDAVIVLSYLKEMGVKVEPFDRGGESRKTIQKGRCGPGFGNMVWRVNCAENRIEASFSKPCPASRILKSKGFRWNHLEGIWTIPNFDVYAEFLNSLGLRQVDPVLARK